METKRSDGPTSSPVPPHGSSASRNVGVTMNDDDRKTSTHTGTLWEARGWALLPTAGGPGAAGLQSHFPGRQSSGGARSRQVCEGPALADPLAVAQPGHTPGRGSRQTSLFRGKTSNLYPLRVSLSCPCISFGENRKKQLEAQGRVGMRHLLHLLRVSRPAGTSGLPATPPSLQAGRLRRRKQPAQCYSACESRRNLTDRLHQPEPSTTSSFEGTAFKKQPKGELSVLASCFSRCCFIRLKNKP